jgi:hypothetical protein
MKGKLVVLLSAGALMLVLTAGVAVAATIIDCPNILDTQNCMGTPKGDVMTGTDEDDVIRGRGGRDRINDAAKQDVDTIAGNGGNDTIDVREGNGGLNNRDLVDCGTGRDRVFFDDGDKVVRCEIKNPS